jgi:hypothetical protein
MNHDLFGGAASYDRWFNTSCHPECPCSLRSILPYSSSTIFLLFIFINVFVFFIMACLTNSLFLFLTLLSDLLSCIFCSAKKRLAD